MTQDTLTPEEETGRTRLRLPRWLILLLMLVGLVFAVLILSRVAGPLYGLIVPMKLPVPDHVTELDHVKPDKGAEYWIYKTKTLGADIAAFYEDQGGDCVYSGEQLNTLDFEESIAPHNVARCTGQKKSGGLVMSWEVYIAEGYPEVEGPTLFRIYKFSEVSW